MPDIDKFKGCFLGLVLGDTLCAPYEGGVLERLAWRFFSTTSEGKLRYTDDTQMSIDLAQSLLKHQKINQDELAKQFSKSYRWSRGYGPAAGKLLKKIKKGERWQDLNKAQYPEGSFGNGAAMRSPILGLAFFSNEEKMTSSVALSAEITHAHKIAIEGAKLIALAVSQAIIGKNNDEILVQLSKLSTISDYQLRINTCNEWLNTKTDISNKEIKKQLGNGIAANESVVSAIYFALSYKNKSFASMIKHIQKLGGDTDTIAAMAGAIWGASNGYNALNQYDINNIENITLIIDLAEKLHQFSAR